MYFKLFLYYGVMRSYVYETRIQKFLNRYQSTTPQDLFTHRKKIIIEGVIELIHTIVTYPSNYNQSELNTL